MKQISLDKFLGYSREMNDVSSVVKSFELMEVLYREVFTPKDLGASYTEINYWDKQGIISTHREGDDKWRNFNFMDYIWIKIVIELREFGVPMKKIKKLKEEVFSPFDFGDTKALYKIVMEQLPGILEMSSETEEYKAEILEFMKQGPEKAFKEFTYFLFMITQSLSEKIPYSLQLFKDGYWLWAIEGTAVEWSKEDLERKKYGTYISVSIVNILNEFMLDPHSAFILSELRILRGSEAQIMKLIHEGNYKSIHITFKNKRIELDLTKRHDTKKRMCEIVREGAYQDILFKYDDYNIAAIENKVKIILDKDK